MNSNVSQANCMTCDTGILEAPRYFPRQLITAADLTLEQDYLRSRMKRFTRLMFGWGVVCGAMVCLVPDTNGTGSSASQSSSALSPAPWKVAVNAGYALGPYGDEILIDCQRIVDLRTTGVSAACGEPPGELIDPWCAQVFVQQRKSPVYVAVKYKEIMTRPVPVQPAGCGCDNTQCEYSRWRDGYEIGVLTACPDSHANPPSSTFEDVLAKGPLTDCPDCPTDPWIVLARVDLDNNGNILAIDNCSCRRMVVSFRQFWWQCSSGGVRVTSQSPISLQRNTQNNPVTVNVSNYQDGAQISLGSDVTIIDTPQNSPAGTITFHVNVGTAAALGSRLLVVTNPDCSVGTLPITIVAQSQPASTAGTTPESNAATDSGTTHASKTRRGT